MAVTYEFTRLFRVLHGLQWKMELFWSLSARFRRPYSKVSVARLNQTWGEGVRMGPVIELAGQCYWVESIHLFRLQVYCGIQFRSSRLQTDWMATLNS